MAELINYSLPSRQETPMQRENNAIAYKAIADAFRKSLEEFDETICDASVSPKSSILFAGEYFDVPYGKKKLSDVGSAVFCFEQGIRNANNYTFVNITRLAKHIDKLGYYDDGKGTSPVLFDHFGLRRASHYIDIYNNIYYRERIVTLLVNENYQFGKRRDESYHYVNVIGKDLNYFAIDDSFLKSLVSIPMMEMLNATEIAWLW